MKQVIVALSFATALIGIYAAQATVSINEIQAVIKIYDATFDGEELIGVSQGSGTIIDPRGYILTNYHVVQNTIESKDSFLVICLTFSSRENPICGAVLTDVVLHNKDLDLALLKIAQVKDANSNWLYFDDWIRMYNIKFPYVPINKDLRSNEGVELGDEIQILGFPSAGGQSITFTKGIVSGFETLRIENASLPYKIKTDAKLNSGNSGGAAFDGQNNFIGVPTEVAGGQGNIGYIIALPIINFFLSSIPDVGVNSGSLSCPDMVNGYLGSDKLCYCKDGYFWDKDQTKCIVAPKSTAPEAVIHCTNGTIDNNNFCHCNDGFDWSNDAGDCVKLPEQDLVEGGCSRDKTFYSGICIDKDEYCSYTSGAGSSWNEISQSCQSPTESPKESDTSEKLSCAVKPTETNARSPKILDGYILLQVESRGEAWYVHPKLGQRLYLKDGTAAYQIMRVLGVGISEKDFVLALDGNQKILNSLKGMIILRVQSRGEAYYIHPKDLSLHYLANGEEAYKIMRNYSLGISNSNLEKIPEADLVCN